MKNRITAIVLIIIQIIIIFHLKEWSSNENTKSLFSFSLGFLSTSILYFLYKIVTEKKETKKKGIRVHMHNFKTPIISMYRGFNTRDIIYECSCGERKIIEVHKGFSEPFPIETAHLITRKEFESYLVPKEIN